MKTNTKYNESNLYKPFASVNIHVLTYINPVKPRNSNHFTQVSAIGKIKTYSRTKLLNTLFARVV